VDNILKIVLLGASVLLTIGVIAGGIFLYNSGQQVVNKSEQDMAGISNQLAMSKLQGYDSTIVTGSQVIGAIRMYGEQGTLNVIVTTREGTAQTYTSEKHYTETDPTDDDYINPTASFKSTLSINSNKVPTAITFSQQP
jgi:hypothetical protein